MTDPKPSELIRQEAEVLEAGIALQAESLKLLLAEMQALATLMPPGKQVSTDVTDASIEAGFDNMPV